MANSPKSIKLNCNSLLGPNDMSQLFSHHILHHMGPMLKRKLRGALLSQQMRTRVMNLPNSVRRNLHLQFECGQIGAHKKRNSARPISCLGAAANFGNSHFAPPALCMPLVFCSLRDAMSVLSSSTLQLVTNAMEFLYSQTHFHFHLISNRYGHKMRQISFYTYV